MQLNTLDLCPVVIQWLMGNRLRPTARGVNIKNSVSVLADGKTYDGWKTVSITKSIESIANTFTLDVHDVFSQRRQKWPLRNGVEIKISIDGKPVFGGFIEVTEPSYQAGARSYIFSGRSKAGDIVDCNHTGPCEYVNISLDKLDHHRAQIQGVQLHFDQLTHPLFLNPQKEHAQLQVPVKF